jgi:histidinol-phosphate/aromatic aminotransferase/cobyric acid decarboxylase-like protein
MPSLHPVHGGTDSMPDPRYDVRVRDTSSFGLRQWIRLSAQPPAAQKALLAALRSAL